MDHVLHCEIDVGRIGLPSHVTASGFKLSCKYERMSSLRSEAVDLDISIGGDAGLVQEI